MVVCVGPDAIDQWRKFQPNASLDVVLMTHPRDEDDVPRLFPWSSQLSLEERRLLTMCLKPIIVEVLTAGQLTVGILILPYFAHDFSDLESRARCREILEGEALRYVAKWGGRFVCLGGLTGSLTGYGLRVVHKARELGITMTTGHAVTAYSMIKTYRRIFAELGVDPSSLQMAILGLGGVGGAFARLLSQESQLPGFITIVDTHSQKKRVERIADELGRLIKSEISVELVDNGQVSTDSACYQAEFLISAVSTPSVIDIAKVAPLTVLIDDSQPYCWDRSKAWERVKNQRDIVPCEAGLVDCTAIDYVAHFPFDFADHDYRGSRTAWSCLTEGMLCALEDRLPGTIGEPDLNHLLLYARAFDDRGLGVPALQCGKHVLPMHDLRKSFLDLRAD
jgi:predicted amino acid dehydrogenase